MQSEKEDPRVFFNTVLTEHAKGGFKEPVALRERIMAIRNSLKERSVHLRTGCLSVLVRSRVSPMHYE